MPNATRARSNEFFLPAAYSAVTMLGLLLLSAGCGRADLPERRYAQVTLNDLVIRAEIADTPDARQQGLSGRDGLMKDEGMLFVFDEARPTTFWMQEMNFPIDIIWIDSGLIVDLAEKVPAGESPPAVRVSEAPARYVLEVAAGTAEKHGWAVGQPAKISW